MKTLLLIALSIAAVAAAERKPTISNRENMPKLTSAEHKAEAEKHTARAMEFEKKAVKHEETEAKLRANTGYNAMQHKWPGLANGPVNRERDRAMQARRAQAESLELAAYHREMASKTGDEAP